MEADTSGDLQKEGFPLYLVFGGSFDPPHIGHLSMVRYVLEQGLCSRLLVVPASTSPFKLQSPPALARHRIALLEILLAKLPDSLRRRVSIETWEIDRPPPSYTIDTLRHFAGLYQKTSNKTSDSSLEVLLLQKRRAFEKKTASSPSLSAFEKNPEGPQIGLLLGSDSAGSLPDWKSAKEILVHFPLFVFRRALGEESAKEKLIFFVKSQEILLPQAIVFLKNPLVDCKSSLIRRQLKAGSEASSCLLPTQINYIKKHNLF